MRLRANIDALLDRRAALSIKNKYKVNRQLPEACKAIKNCTELRVLSNLIVLSRYMKDCLCLVEPDAIYQWY